MEPKRKLEEYEFDMKKLAKEFGLPGKVVHAWVSTPLEGNDKLNIRVEV